jgi:RNA polymerase sigma-70 factor (ECF subfamily)
VFNYQMTIDLEQAYSKYGPMVFRRCSQLLRDEAMARDAVQEVFVQVLERKESLTDAYPSSLLYTMATNVSLNMLRQKRRRLEVGEGDDLIDRIATLDSGFDRLEGRSVLSRIFSRERACTGLIAILHFVDGLTLEEVAKEVHMSVSGVRKRIRVLQSHAKDIEGDLR